MRTPSSLLTGILVASLLPAAAADPYGTDCSDPSTYDSVSNGGFWDDVQCLTIAGPGSTTHKSLLGAGLGVCIDETGSPVPCNDPGAPQSGVGAAIFDSSTWSHGEKAVYTWVGYLGDGFCAPQACGFDVLLCNDRDYDGTCTNLPDPATAPDQLFSTTSNEALVGGGYLVCTPVLTIPMPPALPSTCEPDFVAPTVGGDCSDEDKDLKDCGDDLDAEVGGCMNPALQPPATADWNYGQVVVFIGAWVDSWPGTPASPTNVGAGIAVGHFDVWMGMWGACNLPACNDKQDNDGDGTKDYPKENVPAAVLECWGPNDNSELLDCNDGRDNDGDGLTDSGLGGDDGCDNATDPSEKEQCDDKIDNDGDGLTDAADQTGGAPPTGPGCIGPADNNEAA